MATLISVVRTAAPLGLRPSESIQLAALCEASEEASTFGRVVKSRPSRTLSPMPTSGERSNGTAAEVGSTAKSPVAPR